jgi:hypothetical protein
VKPAVNRAGRKIMRNFISAKVAIVLLGCSLFAVTADRTMQAADDKQSYDNSVLNFKNALAKGDPQAVAGLLDDNFQGIEAHGEMHTKAQVLENLPAFAKDNEGDLDVRTLDLLGDAKRVLGIHHDQRFAHIWVKRPEGWRALVFLNIPIPPQRSENTVVPKAPSDPNADCENPCRTLPYKPENAAQEGAIATWFRLKNSEWHPNAEVWDANSDENHETISPRMDLPKLEHVVQLTQQRKLYGEKGANPGQPVLSMRMYDVGNVVVQECLQGPKGATKPVTFVMRVFINRGNGWKIILSAQTNIGQAGGESN